MSIYEKMFNVMDNTEAIIKDMTVGEGGNSYKAVSEATILNMIKPLFKQYKLIIFPIDGDISDHTMVWEKTYKGATSQTLRAMTELKVKYRIVDTESGEFQDIVGFGNGADSQDKGAGKTFTYSFKSALSKTFMLFSGDDTDNEHSGDIDKKNTSNKTQQGKSTPETEKQLKNDSTVLKISKADADELDKVMKKIHYNYADFLVKYNVNELTDLTTEQYAAAIVEMNTIIRELKANK